jgi:hypothetical protein
MQKGGYFHPPFCLMFHPSFAYCLWSVVCRAGFGKPDLPSVWPAPGRIRFSGLCLVRVSGSRRWLHLRFPALLAPPALGLACFCGLGVGYFSGFYLVRLFRFSALPALPVSGVGCFSGFHLSASAVFSLTCSCGSRICPALRLDALLRQLSVSSPLALH